MGVNEKERERVSLCVGVCGGVSLCGGKKECVPETKTVRGETNNGRNLSQQSLTIALSFSLSLSLFLTAATSHHDKEAKNLLD